MIIAEADSSIYIDPAGRYLGETHKHINQM